MLHELRIRNFAIIDELTLSFRSGLNVITGETGTGKSIILEALGLLCGARADTDFIRGDSGEAVVEGLFECAPPAALGEALGVDGNEILVRRHISRSGKSRIYVNGSPSTLVLLARLGSELVHIYGQHDHALLLRPASQLELVDALAGLLHERARMAAAYAAYRNAGERLEALERVGQSLSARRELLEAHVAELRQAELREGECSELRRERELLRHADRVQQLCREGEVMLYSGDAAVGQRLTRLAGQLAALAGVAPTLANAIDLVETARVQLEEAARDLRATAERLEANPDRLDAVEARLDMLGRLSRKHNVAPDDLPEVASALAGELAALAAQEEGAAELHHEVERRGAEARALAEELSAARQAAARQLEERMIAELAVLGLPGAIFRVHGAAADEARGVPLGPTGSNALEFFLAANPGEPVRPLARVASGGELSRIMLALKALTAATGETPILIFDEVDAGIGGTVADAVARRLKDLARNRQLLCITHLPQIAAYADHHYAIEKSGHSGRTMTSARALSGGERIAEVSRMLGGGVAPVEAERYARRLLAAAQQRSA